MQATPRDFKSTTRAGRGQGFALPVVMAGLLVIAALFATVQMRGLGQISHFTAEQELLTRMADRRQLLDLAIVALNRAPVSGRVGLADGSGRFLVLQDVGGLIDLNSAHPDLLERLCRYLMLDASCPTNLRTWRRTGRRLLSVQDFARVVGLPQSRVGELATSATVFSGRFGIDPVSAPEIVLLIARRDAKTVPQAFIDQPTSTTFAVWLLLGNSPTSVYLGTVQKLPALADWRVLEIR